MDGMLPEGSAVILGFLILAGWVLWGFLPNTDIRERDWELRKSWLIAIVAFILLTILAFNFGMTEEIFFFRGGVIIFFVSVFIGVFIENGKK